MRKVIGGTVAALLVGVAALAAGGAGILFQSTFRASGVGSVDRTAMDKLRDTVSAKDKGAKGDGTTDDGPVLAAWITAQGTTPATLIFPAGTYLTNSNLIFPITVRVRMDGSGFTGTGTVTYNGDLQEQHHTFLTDTSSSSAIGMLEVLHNAANSSAYGLDIKSFADVPAAPGAGLGGGGLIALHEYSDRGPGAFQLDNVRSQPAIILRNTHNEFRALGQGGTGHFIDFVGYAAGTPYAANGGLGTDPVFLGQLEGGTPGTPLTFASKNAATPWQFRSDTSAPSLKIVGGGTGIGLQIAQVVAATALSISQSSAATAVNISSDVNANGFYPMVVTGYSHGPKFTTTINSGPLLTLDQEVIGGNQLFYILNKSVGASIRVATGSGDVFFVNSDGSLATTATKTKGTCTLNGASPAVCTATVISGATCVATAVGTTAAAAIPLVVSVTTTTLTVTAANGATSVVNYICLG